MSVCRSTGSGGRPGRDCHRQNRQNPCRCHRVNVAGCTMVKACRQSNQRPSQTRASRVAGDARLGLTLRSWYRASCQVFAQIPHPDTPTKERGKACLEQRCERTQGGETPADPPSRAATGCRLVRPRHPGVSVRTQSPASASAPPAGMRLPTRAGERVSTVGSPRPRAPPLSTVQPPYLVALRGPPTSCTAPQRGEREAAGPSRRPRPWADPAGGQKRMGHTDSQGPLRRVVLSM
jgi:hypothetical protein